MSHEHVVFDTDKSFSIDPISRLIVKDAEDKKTLVVQHDHKSEQFTFRIPRIVEGHDMLLSNRVEVHYLNIGALKKDRAIGVYTVEDLKADPENDSLVMCTWLISHNATQYAGSLHFALRFSCITDGSVDYSWNTIPYTGILVSDSIYNEDAVEDYTDILEQWELRLMNSMIVDINQTVVSTETGGVNVITMTRGDGTQSNFEVRNGGLPVKGTDYWTETDQTEIVDDVLEALNYETSRMSIFVDTDGVLNVLYTNTSDSVQVENMTFSIDGEGVVNVSY